MFITSARTMVTEAFRAALASDRHPGLQGMDLWVGQDYPATQVNYPGVWVDFVPNGKVQSAGIGHTEVRSDSAMRPVVGTRWRFSGTVSATAVALTGLQRDRLADELVRMVAFANEHPDLLVLREHVESNDLIEMNLQWDTATLSAFMDSPGTPWGSDDTVHEVTVSMLAEGSFISIIEGQVPTGFLEGVDVFPEPTIDPTKVDPNWMPTGQWQ